VRGFCRQVLEPAEEFDWHGALAALVRYASPGALLQAARRGAQRAVTSTPDHAPPPVMKLSTT